MIFIDELWKMVNNLDNYLKDIISRKTINIYGTKLYWINAYYKFEAMIRDLNEQISFFIII